MACDRKRHLADLAVLAAMIERSDRLADDMTRRDRMHLAGAINGLWSNRPVWVGIDGAERGVDALARIVVQ